MQVVLRPNRAAKPQTLRSAPLRRYLAQLKASGMASWRSFSMRATTKRDSSGVRNFRRKVLEESSLLGWVSGMGWGLWWRMRIRGDSREIDD